MSAYVKPAWHAEALRMFNDGVTVAEIARRFGRSRSTVAFAVNYMDERERTAARVKKHRTRRRQEAA